MIGSTIQRYVLLGLLVVAMVLGVALKYEAARVDTLTSQVTSYAAAEKTYQKEIANSNASILAYQDEAKKRQADSAAAQESIKPQVIKYETKAIRILAAKPSSTSTCTSSEQLFNDYLAGRTQ